MTGVPVKKAVSDDGDQAFAGKLMGGEPHVAGGEAGWLAFAKADAEGAAQVEVRIEGVLPLEDCSARADDPAGDTLQVGSGGPGVREEELAVGRVVGAVLEDFRGECVPVAFGLRVELVEVVGHLEADMLQIGRAFGPNHD